MYQACSHTQAHRHTSAQLWLRQQSDKFKYTKPAHNLLFNFVITKSKNREQREKKINERTNAYKYTHRYKRSFLLLFRSLFFFIFLYLSHFLFIFTHLHVCIRAWNIWDTIWKLCVQCARAVTSVETGWESKKQCNKIHEKRADEWNRCVWCSCFVNGLSGDFVCFIRF